MRMLASGSVVLRGAAGIFERARRLTYGPTHNRTMSGIVISGEDPPATTLSDEHLLEYRAAIIGGLKIREGDIGKCLLAIAFVVHEGSLRYEFMTASRSLASISDRFEDFIEEVTGRPPRRRTSRLVTLRVRVGWRQSGYKNHLMVIVYHPHDPFVRPLHVSKNGAEVCTCCEGCGQPMPER